jgi:hypothetical protein
MARATHTIGFRHFTFGKWREPGTPVDASSWPNRALLEESGYLKTLPPDAKVEVPEDRPRQAAASVTLQAEDPAGAQAPVLTAPTAGDPSAPAAPKPPTSAKKAKTTKSAAGPKKPRGAR